MSTLQFIQTSPSELVNLISEETKRQLENFKKELLNQEADNELLTRTEAYEFLKIDSSTLWSWTKAGKIPCYSIAHRRYYKRSELLKSLKIVKQQP